MDYSAPDELEFFEREFYIAEDNDPEELKFSYMKTFSSGEKLIFTHSPWEKSVCVRLVRDSLEIFHIYEENVSWICFQSWGKESIIRVYFTSNDQRDFLVFYRPTPRIRFSIS